MAIGYHGVDRPIQTQNGEVSQIQSLTVRRTAALQRGIVHHGMWLETALERGGPLGLFEISL